MRLGLPDLTSAKLDARKQSQRVSTVKEEVLMLFLKMH